MSRGAKFVIGLGVIVMTLWPVFGELERGGGEAARVLEVLRMVAPGSVVWAELVRDGLTGEHTSLGAAAEGEAGTESGASAGVSRAADAETDEEQFALAVRAESPAENVQSDPDVQDNPSVPDVAIPSSTAEGSVVGSENGSSLPSSFSESVVDDADDIGAIRQSDLLGAAAETGLGSIATPLGPGPASAVLAEPGTAVQEAAEPTASTSQAELPPTAGMSLLDVSEATTATPTLISTPTQNPNPIFTYTATAAARARATPQPSPLPVLLTSTWTPGAIAMATATWTAQPLPTATPAPTWTATEAPAPTETTAETPVPTWTPQPLPTETATFIPTPTFTPMPTPTATSTFTATPAPVVGVIEFAWAAGGSTGSPTGGGQANTVEPVTGVGIELVTSQVYAMHPNGKWVRLSGGTELTLRFDRAVSELRMGLRDVDGRGGELVNNMSPEPVGVTGDLELDPTNNEVRPLGENRAGEIVYRDVSAVQLSVQPAGGVIELAYLSLVVGQ